MQKNKTIKIISIFVFVVLTVLVVKLLHVQSKLNEFKQQDLVPISQLDEANEVLSALEKLAKIDEKFILNNNFDEAIKAYQDFITKNPSLNKLAQVRLDKLNKDLKMQRQDEGLNIETQLQQYKKRVDSLSNEKDSLKNYFSNRVNKLSSLNDSLSSVISENNSLLNRKEIVKIVTFKDEKNLLIHYLGEVKNGMANGNGVGIWENGNIYRGEWKDNKKHGSGELTWKDGAKYTGDYVADVRSGRGTFMYTTGEKYIGEFNKGLRDGEGTLYDRDNNVSYKGTWKNDKPNQ